MFDPALYTARRSALIAALQNRQPGALVLILGNEDAPMNFRANSYAFRQDGSFRYFFGLNEPGLAGLIDLCAGEATLFGDDVGVDAAVWLGAQPPFAAQAERAGVTRTAPRAALAGVLAQARAAGRPVLFLPPYRADTQLTLATLLDRPVATVAAAASVDLIQAVVALREIKSDAEIAEMEEVLAVTQAMHHAAMAATRPGVTEHAVVGLFEGIARGADLRLAYQSIFSGRGEVLHNLRYDRTLAAGELVVNDSGAAGAGGYASDITRTLPVSGRFDPMQRRLYDAVLRAQQEAIAACRPGVPYAAIHRGAALVLATELAELGLFRGDPAQVVDSGAYAIAFPCGLGHQIGLDVHDMEGLGEDHVGYTDTVRRSPLFGLRSLRLGKPLRAGMTVTVEPGLYFIPELIDLWRSEGRHAALVDYDRFDSFRTFGGIRIEDDVLVTEAGGRVLGPPIARTADEVEARMGTAA